MTPRASRPWVTPMPAVLVIVAVVGLALHGPIRQFDNYHAFADSRTLFGVPRALDVLSNFAFAVVAFVGLRRRWQNRGNDVRTGEANREGTGDGSVAWTWFLVSLVATAVGSAFYHLAPANGRLIWDRLPIAIGCASLLAAMRADLGLSGKPPRDLFGLVVLAVGSVAWWHVTDRMGQDDLRPYLLLQALPLVLIPLWQAVCGAPQDQRLGYGLAISLYVLAKVAELGDHVIFDLTGIISGHTVKHLLAAVATGVIVLRPLRITPRSREARLPEVVSA